MVDKITTLAQVVVPDEIRLEYSQTTPWPGKIYSGEVEILISMEELAIHPRLLEIQGTLGVFQSNFSQMPILGGCHDKISPAHIKWSQDCLMIRTTPGGAGIQAVVTPSQGHSLVTDPSQEHSLASNPSHQCHSFVTNISQGQNGMVNSTRGHTDVATTTQFSKTTTIKQQ